MNRKDRVLPQDRSLFTSPSLIRIKNTVFLNDNILNLILKKYFSQEFSKKDITYSVQIFKMHVKFRENIIRKFNS